MNMIEQIKITITGKVQGVFFRGSTLAAAQKLKLKGYVKNLDNGDVLVVAQGESAVLEQLVSWCHQGPPSATVTSVIIVKQNEIEEFSRFEIKR